jgi:hypothetical protein
LLPDFYSGATGLSGCFVRDFLSGALTLRQQIFYEIPTDPKRRKRLPSRMLAQILDRSLNEAETQLMKMKIELRVHINRGLTSVPMD